MLRLINGTAARRYLVSGNVARRYLTTAVSDRGGAIITGPAGTPIHLPPAEGAVGPVTVEPFGEVDSYKKAIFCPATSILRTSTHVGTDDDGRVFKGLVKDGMLPVAGAISKEEAKQHARNAGLRLLSTIHHALDGDMSRVEQVIKLTGLVNGVGDGQFHAHGFVINGCSEVLIEAFGPERGVGVRVCSGTASLFGAVSCDVELRVRPAAGD